MKYFYLHFNDEDGGGVAYTTPDGIDSVEKLQAMQGELIQFFLKNDYPQDYQANDFGWPLMSENLKGILDAVKEGVSVIWYRAGVLCREKTSDYFIPHFFCSFDILDSSRSKFVSGPLGNMLIKACLDRRKVQGMEFFALPDSEMRLVISERLKLKIKEAGITGVDFSEVAVS